MLQPSSLPLWRSVLLLGMAASAGLACVAARAEASRAVAAVEVDPAPQTAPPSPNIDNTVRLAPAKPVYLPLRTETGKPVVADPEARRKRVIVVGSATERLLALQTASPGVHPRPIDGEQASRSYQRYLKSFETKIPERFDTGLDVKK